MNHNGTPLVHSNRQGSRRLHRCLGLSAVSSCIAGLNLLGRTSVTVVGFPQAIIRDDAHFERLAAELRIAELEKALDEARETACTDPLTGALNRRGFDKASQRELARARRSGTWFALVHIDLDDFKRLNDTLGHQAGDKALVYLVELLHKSMRPADVLCRIGGEEFVLMLPDTVLEDASVVVSRFLTEFSAQAIPGTEHVMTFSAGVVLPGPNESIEEALGRADAATYAAKRAGKNCVVSC